MYYEYVASPSSEQRGLRARCDAHDVSIEETSRKSSKKQIPLRFPVYPDGTGHMPWESQSRMFVNCDEPVLETLTNVEHLQRGYQSDGAV